MRIRWRMLVYVLQEGLRSLKRNGWLNFAAAGTTAVSLFVLGIAILLVINTGYIAKTVESNVEIMAYVKNGTGHEQIQELKDQLKEIKGVNNVTFIPKEEGLKSLAEQFGKKDQLMQSLEGNNPLPDAFRVRTRDPRAVTATAKTIKALPAIEEVRYGQGAVENMFKLTAWVRLISVVVMVLLGICAVFLIATTIRLTMFARRREINIMKYVGASDWFVRGPFLLEGIILGGIGAIIGGGVLLVSYDALVNKLHETVSFLPLMNDSSVLVNLSLGLLGGGVLLGIIGSMISVHRYLRA